MESFLFFDRFYSVIADDARIGVTHISLYMALLKQWNMEGGRNPFSMQRKEIMNRAKISARHTYNRCINQLQEYGYLRYLPATNSFTKSTVYLRELSGDFLSKHVL